MSKNLESLNSLTPAIYGEVIVAQLNATPRNFAYLATPEGQAYLEERKQKREAERQARIRANPPVIEIEAFGFESDGFDVTCTTCEQVILEREHSALPYARLKELVEGHTCE